MIKVDFYIQRSFEITRDVERQVKKDEVQGVSEEGERKAPGWQELSTEEKKELGELKEIDRKVRQHEMAHLTAATGIAVYGATFSYKLGPDGQLYAVSGEVRIDSSEVPNDPQATVEKMKKVQRAALAPADPSPQDRRVAAEAAAKEQKARLNLQQAEKYRFTTDWAISSSGKEIDLQT